MCCDLPGTLGNGAMDGRKLLLLDRILILLCASWEVFTVVANWMSGAELRASSIATKLTVLALLYLWWKRIKPAMIILIVLNVFAAAGYLFLVIYASFSNDQGWDRLAWLSYGVQAVAGLGLAIYLIWRVRTLFAEEVEPPIRRSTGHTIE